MGLQDWKEILRNLRGGLSDEEINNLIIYEEEKERQRHREEQPELRLPLPEPYYERHEKPQPPPEESERGVIIIEL
jgi:hypothetical protein